MVDVTQAALYELSLIFIKLSLHGSIPISQTSIPISQTHKQSYRKATCSVTQRRINTANSYPQLMLLHWGLPFQDFLSLEITYLIFIVALQVPLDPRVWNCLIDMHAFHGDPCAQPKPGDRIHHTENGIEPLHPSAADGDCHHASEHQLLEMESSARGQKTLPSPLWPSECCGINPQSGRLS